MVDQPVTQGNLFVPEAPGNLTVLERACWIRQDAVILAYQGLGTLSKASEAVGLGSDAVYLWSKQNIHGFNERMERGRQGYRDYLENMVHERLSNPTGNRGSDVLLMGALNANHPDKWSRNVQVTHEVGREVMATLAKIQEQQETRKPGLPGVPERPWEQTVEGTVVDAEEGP